MGDSFEKQLQGAYSTDLVLRHLFDDFAGRERNRRITNIDWVVSTFHVMRSEATRAFKTLESLGCGVYREGRGKNPSRFEWHHPTIHVARIASGRLECDQPLTSSIEPRLKVPLITRRFELRPELVLELDLPSDLTRREAEKLASFLAAFTVD